MASIVKNLSLSEGIATPTSALSNVTTSTVGSFATQALYETYLGRVMASGDMYYNTTDKVYYRMENSVVLPITGNIGGFKNYLIDGKFDFYNVTSQTASGYEADAMWNNVHSGTTKTASIQAFTVGQTDVPGNPTNYSRTVVTSSAGASNQCTKYQPIENVTLLSGKTVTLSFYAKADSAKNISVELVQNFGTGGSPSAEVTGIGTTKIALTTSWAKYTVTTTLPSVSGKTIGSDANTSKTLVIFWFDAGSNFNARTNTLGQQSGTFEIANVLLEDGTVATDYPVIPRTLEQTRVRRYVKTINAYSIVGTTSTLQNHGYSPFDMVMRGIPALVSGQSTCTASSGNNGTLALTNPSTIGTGLYNSANNWTVGASITITAVLDARI